MKDIKSIIAKNLTDLRKLHGLTQAQLAEQINYSDKAVSKWERGEASMDIETLFRLAELFHVDIDYFFEENASENVEHYSNKSMFVARRIGILILALMAILFVAIAMYVTTFWQNWPFKEKAWIVYIWASAIGCCVSWLFCKAHKYKIASLVLVSCFVWSTIASIYLTALVNGVNFWMIFLVGIPIQAALLVYKLLRVRTK